LVGVKSGDIAHRYKNEYNKGYRENGWGKYSNAWDVENTGRESENPIMSKL